MAAGQQKKRLTSSNLLEQCRGKKKQKLDSSDYVLKFKSHVYLEWDDCQRRAVAKREQVGITWRDMAPFIDSVPQLHSGLADVISVPHEIFRLEDMTEVLSYEVWATCLSESERKLLTQFLPSGTSAEQVVQSLLMGENHHFGNPYLKWSASLCSGNLHPDAVLQMERHFRANKKAYYSELNIYHNDLLEVLKKWKERCCKDPENFWREGFAKQKQGSLHIAAERGKVAPLYKKEMPQVSCIRYGDAAKYMSYIKISRKQHQLVKNIKQSGDGIQSKSLNRVLGDIKGFHVHPYEKFEEEEKKRLHEHWLLVAKKDLPLAFESHRERKSQGEKMRKSLEKELAEKKKVMMDKDEEMENLESSPLEQVDNGESEHHSDMPDKEDVDAARNSTHDPHLDRLPSLNSHQELSPVVLDQGVSQDFPKPAENSPVLSQFLGNMNSMENVMEPKVSMSSAKDMWQAVNIRESYYQPISESHGYTSAGELSLRQPQPIDELPTHAIDLERDILDQGAGESVGSALHMDSGPPLFCSYANQDRNELLPPFPKGHGMLPSYPHEHMNGLKQPGLQFLMANDSLSESGQFRHQFQEQQQSLEERQYRERELYMHQMMNRNLYSSSRYPIQGHFSSVDSQSLAAPQSSVNGGLVGINWFQGEHRAPNGWSGVESSSSGGQCLGDVGNADGSLFSVLSECRNLPSNSPYDSMSSEHFIHARNFTGVGIPTNDNIYPYAPQQLRGSSSHGAVATPSTLKMTDGSWMNFPHQNPGLHDSIAKSFLRSWNQ